MDKLKTVYSSAQAASISIAITALVTIVSELSAEFKTFLAEFTGHHWVTKSWLSIIVFVLFFILFWYTNKTVSQTKTKNSLLILQWVTVLGFFSILGYYIYHFFSG